MTSSRRRFIAAIGTATLAGCASFGGSSAETIPDDTGVSLDAISTDWPMVRKDAGNTGFTAIDSGAKPAGLAWKTEATVFTEPVLADERLFYIDLDSTTTALDAVTGEELWAVDAFERTDPWFPLAADSDRLYVPGMDTLVARDVQTGDVLWERDYPVRSPPRLHNGSMYVSLAFDSLVYELEPTTGDIRQKIEFTDRVGTLTVDPYGLTALVDQTAIERRTHEGEQQWRQDINTNAFRLSVGDGVAVVSGRQGDVYALDIETGRQRWRYDTDGTRVLSAPTIAHDRVFVFDHEGVVHAISDGDAVWTWETDTEETGPPGANRSYEITATETWLYTSGFDGYVHVLNPAAPERPLESRWRTDAELTSAPVVSESVAILPGWLRAVKLE